MLKKFVMYLNLLVLVGACTHTEIDPNDVDAQFNAANAFYVDEDYQFAVSKLGEFRAHFPYSKYNSKVDLHISNSYFELGQYAEASSSYEIFLKLHPNHPKVDFVMFRIGLSYWAEAPEAIDREQDLTKTAISEWNKLTRKFPDSIYTTKAKKLIKEGILRVAKNNLFIVKFYCKQGLYASCAYRAVNLIDEFSKFKDLHIQALNYAVIALNKLAAAKRLDEDSDKNLFYKNLNADEIAQKATKFAQLLENFQN